MSHSISEPDWKLFRQLRETTGAVLSACAVRDRASRPHNEDCTRAVSGSVPSHRTTRPGGGNAVQQSTAICRVSTTCLHPVAFITDRRRNVSFQRRHPRGGTSFFRSVMQLRALLRSGPIFEAFADGVGHFLAHTRHAETIEILQVRAVQQRLHAEVGEWVLVEFQHSQSVDVGQLAIPPPPHRRCGSSLTR